MAMTQEQLDAIKRANGGVLPRELESAQISTSAAQRLVGSTPTVTKPAATTAPAPTRSTSRAVSGYAIPTGVSDVSALQRDLNAKGAGLTVDGVYGPKTDAAYKRYGLTSSATPAATATTTPTAATKPANPYDVLGYKPSAYKSKYYDDAIALIRDAQDDVYDPKTYDPEKDAEFTTFRDGAIAAGQRGYSANLGTMNRNGLASSSVAQQIAQGAMDAQTVAIKNAIPKFQAADEAKFYDARDRKLTEAERLLNLDKTDYQRFVDEENRNISAQERYQEDTGMLALNPGVKTYDAQNAEAKALLSRTRSSGTGGTSKAKTSATADADMNELLNGMLESGDPVGWYAKYLPSLTEAQRKYLKGYALDKYSDPTKILSSAPNGTKATFRTLVNGETPYSMDNPYGGASWNSFRGNPQAALNAVTTNPAYRNALGSLYDYTVSTLKAMVAEQTAAAKANPTTPTLTPVERAVSAIKSSADPYAMFAGWARQITTQDGYGAMLAALKQVTGSRFSQAALNAALAGPSGITGR